ncbi:MAG: sulfatase-like hydrolase/transferase [Actinomycetota bacterium]
MFRRHFLTYLALSTMAIAQPLLDLYGKNTTVFSAGKLSPLEVAVFLLLVGLAPALTCVVLDRFSAMFGPKVNEAMRLSLIGGLSLVLGLAVARWLHINRTIPSVAIGIVLAIVMPIAFDRSKAFREWSRWLSLLAVAVLGSAVIALQPVLLESDGPQSDAVIGKKDVTVLQVIFDEFPLASLLGSDGNINAVRFPGFAELAQGSTWYRNSVAESNFTHQAVPAILSSSVPAQTGGPFLSQYPKNIFTLFADATSVGGIEPVTSLCPHSVCGGKSGVAFSFSAGRLKTFLRDAAFVYGQRVFPPVLRKYVPSIEGTWGGFGAVANKFKDQFAVGALSQVGAVERAVQIVAESKSPRVQVVHALLPHAPWRITPDFRIDPLSPTISTQNPDNEEVIRDMYQTFLYQVGAADRVIQNLISDLKNSGKWESTMLVVSADHGISFIPTMPQRHTDFMDPDQVADIYRIPTFIKYPNQKKGVSDDCAISNLDLLPTIIDVTETVSSWTFAGKSLAHDCPTGRVRRVVSATGQTAVIAGGFEEARSRAAHYAEIVSNVGSINKVASVGESASLIDTRIGKHGADTRITVWTIKQKHLFTNVSGKRGATIPALITGEITLSQPLDAGTEGIITVDGIAAGVIGELSGARSVVGFTAVLDYTLLTPGAHTVELFIRNPDGSLTSAGAPS